MNKRIIIITIISLIIDQSTKILASLLLTLNDQTQIIKNFFYLTLCHNTGMAWSILDNKRFLIIIFSLIALIFIYKFMKTFKNNLRNNIAFGLLLGGLFGNLIDRLFFGYVTDFLDFYLFGYDYPIFNMADIFIVVSIILLIISILKGDDESESNSTKRRKTRQVPSE